MRESRMDIPSIDPANIWYTHHRTKTHGVFLEYIESGTLKIDKLESRII
jgi:hypothetical protein